jgi:hypothetical protein
VGWLGNFFIIWGMFLVGNKNPNCFLFSITGEIIWSYHAISIGMYDLAAISIIFIGVALRNYFKWRREAQRNTLVK